MDEIEQVKERLNIEEVVGSYLTLKRAGANLKGLCPFHNEKTPSFMVNPERQIFKCFGCGEGGDIFTFIEKVEGVDFYNALKILADRAGVKLTSKSIQHGSEQHQADSKTVLYEINDWAAKVYHKLLTDHTKADKARRYLRERGLSEETIKNFQIGYAPDSWDFLIRFMSSKKFNKQDVFKAGLLVQNSKGDYYDRFRGRIIFPINNVMGNAIGFTSRVLVDDGKQAKYINSAESLIYHKGKVLYGLDKAKLSIREQGLAVVVEGNMDVIACHQAGFKNVVASSGTAITEDQIRALSRYTPDIAFAFDSDSAGQIAMKRAITTAMQIDISVKIIEIPGGFKDPDEVIKKDRKIWHNAVASARPAIEAWTELLMRQSDTSDIIARKKIAKEILPVIKMSSSAIEKEYYIKYLAKKLAVSENSLLTDLDKTKVDKTETSAEAKKMPELNIYQRVLGIIWNHPELAEIAAGKIQQKEETSDKDVPLSWYKLADNKLKKTNLADAEIAEIEQWAYQVSLDYQDAGPDEIKTELLFLFSRLQQDKNEVVKEKYAHLIREAQEMGDTEKLKKLLQEFSRLIKE